MKRAILFSALSALLLIACTTTHPNTPSGGEAIPVVSLKIKQMKSLSYTYKTGNVGCSEIEFLKNFVGKKVKTEDGVIQVDNIMDIHKSESSSQMSVPVLGIKGDEMFECSFWGLGVEYEK